jgi:hypothetical protein
VPERSKLLAELADFDEIRIAEPAQPDEVLAAAFLVRQADAAAFERRVEEVARRHAARLRVRLVGPTAPYDFVGEA